MGSSLAIASGGYSAEVCRLLVTVASLVTELGLQAHGLQQLLKSSTGLVVPGPVESPLTEDGTHVPCIAR